MPAVSTVIVDPPREGFAGMGLRACGGSEWEGSCNVFRVARFCLQLLDAGRKARKVRQLHSFLAAPPMGPSNREEPLRPPVFPETPSFLGLPGSPSDSTRKELYMVVSKNRGTPIKAPKIL